MQFVAKVDSNGKLHFADDGQRFVYERFVALYSATGKYFKFSIDENIGHTTENQVNLFKRLVLLICESSGDEYPSVYKQLHYQHAPRTQKDSLFGDIDDQIIDVTKMDRKQFQEFFERCVMLANDMFNAGIEIRTDEAVGTIMTINNKRI